MFQFFDWLDRSQTKPARIIHQLLPVLICAFLYVFFIVSSRFFISDLINPGLMEKVSLEFHWVDVLVGFFLYFVTAIDYALVVGRMQTVNTGSRARVVMNVATVMGCYVGVTGVLFLWGFAKEVTWLIIPILIFAGSVMVKLADEGVDYFENSNLPRFITQPTILFVRVLYFLTRIFTFWMPEIAKPSVKPMKLTHLFWWSFLLPFIIGLDDLIGYLGAMTIYNVFGLLVGIYFADVLIDVLIFISPQNTKKLVESAFLSLVATFAFIFLAYKSFSESMFLLHERMLISQKTIAFDVLLFMVVVVIADLIMARLQHRKSFIAHTVDLRK